MQNVAFVYSARETPWPGMGRYFLEHKGIIADIVERGETLIRKRLGVSLRAVLASEKPFPEALLTPINAVTQIALSAEWRERGLHPSALIARCSGEFAAAHASGALSFEDALEPPCRIAGLINSGKGRGKILVVRLPWEEARAVSADCPVRYEVVSEADENSSVVGCAENDASAVRAFFTSKNVSCAVTPLIIASHTWLIEELRDDLHRPLSGSTQPARLPIYSATARGVLPAVHDWALHFWKVVREDLSVRAVIGAALDDGITRFVEVGGQPTLRGIIENEAAARGLSLSSLATMERNRPLKATMDETLAAFEEARIAA